MKRDKKTARVSTLLAEDAETSEYNDSSRMR